MDLTINVLDKGFVRLVDTLGDEQRIVDAARVSYGKGTKLKRGNEKLIRYLLTHNHWSPFEQVVFVFHIKLPLFINQQLLRYRTARVNQISARYSEMQEEFHIPLQLRKQSSKNLQSSEGRLEAKTEQSLIQEMKDLQIECFRVYELLLKEGVAREQAREVLPTSLYTEIYWQIDLRNCLNFLSQRIDKAAQAEIQEYATAIKDLITPLVPTVIEYFEHQGTVIDSMT